MRTYQKVLIAAAGVAIAGTMAAAGVLASFGSGMCNNEQLAEVASPSGSHRAVIFQRDCGATTGFSTQVSVLRAGQDLPDDGGNVFIADTDGGQAPSGPGGGPAVEAAWAREGQLLVRYHHRARVFRSESHHDGVELQYVAE